MWRMPDESGSRSNSWKNQQAVETLIIQEEGGTIKTVEKGVRYAQEMVAEAGLLRREEFPISELILGTNCGG